MGTSKIAKGLNDQYFTPLFIIEDIKENLFTHLPKDSKVLEPCVGSGAFVEALPEYHWTTNDLHPQINFIPDYNVDFVSNYGIFKGYDGVITNPPFGRSSSLAYSILKKSVLVADVVGMVLPKSLARDTGLQRITPLACLYEHRDLGFVDFITSDKQIKKVGCVWQVWGSDRNKSLYANHKSDNLLDLRSDLIQEGSDLWLGLWGNGCAGKVKENKPTWKEVYGLSFRDRQAKELFLEIDWRGVAKKTASTMLRLTKKQVISYYNKLACAKGLQEYDEQVNYFSLEL